VVEGVHADVLEAAVGGPAVPAFPHGGCAEFDLVEPTGVFLVEEERAGEGCR
jgi:hypothetical protein